MTEIKERLFEASRQDHALLGGTLYKPGELLRAGDLREAKAVAEALVAGAGAHIALEESDFCPALDALAELVDKAHEEKPTWQSVLFTF